MNHDELLKFQMTAHDGPGRFIAVEGLDGTGKTSLVRRLSSYVESKGFETVRLRVPTTHMRNSWMFRRLHRENMQNEIDALAFEVAYMADRIQLSRNVIAPALAQGKIVICDRYVLSSIGSLLVRVPDLLDVVDSSYVTNGWFGELTRQLTRPDLSVFLHAESEVAIHRLLKRKTERSFDIEGNSYEKVFQIGKSLAEFNGMRTIDTTTCPLNEVFDEVKGMVTEVLKW